MRLSGIALIFLSSVLTGCGGGGGDGGGIQGSTGIPSELAGVWDVSETFDGLYDEFYVVIRRNGTGTDYDYAGDSYDNHANCYWIDQFEIESLGDDEYRIEYSDGTFDVTLTAEDDTLYVNGTPYERATQEESDFTPECD